jgi:hypothetical protein
MLSNDITYQSNKAGGSDEYIRKLLNLQGATLLISLIILPYTIKLYYYPYPGLVAS